MPEQFPLMHALDELTPGAKAGVVVRALEASRSGNMRSGALYDLAVEVDGEGAEKARELALSEANDDRKLLQFATGLQHNGHGGWLLARIERDLAARSAGIVARGLVLAGFLTKSDEHDSWWVANDEPPATGWLAEVHAAARAEYRRAGHVRHWSARYREAADDIAALCAHVLFSSGADGRALIDGSRHSDEEIRGWSWRRRVHWTVGWKEARATVKKHEDRLAKRFLASDLPSQNQSPRRQ